MKPVLVCLLIFAVRHLECSSLAERNTSNSELKEPCIDNQKLLDKMNGLMKDIQTYLGKGEGSQTLPNAKNGWSRSTYIHWGKAACSKGSTLVYSGYASGNNYHHSPSNQHYKGGPANTLCLPREPIYANYTAGKTDASMIYGAEYYEGRTSPNFKHLLYHDVPCAVCQTRGESNVIMIPARNECYPGWKVKYWGYLMSDYYGHTASEYICVDQEAEPTAGGKERKYGRLLYLVESRCGSLPCPPYMDYLELTCVVCGN